MLPLNKYEYCLEGFEKVVQIRLMNVLFGNNVKTLVHFRDITNLLNNKIDSDNTELEQ